MRRTFGPAMLGLVAGIDNLGAGMAFAALLFPGALAVGLGMGVGAMLLSGALLSLMVALRSRNPNSVAMVQETSIAILAPAIVGMVATMPSATSDAKVASVFAVLGGCTVLTGILFWCFGRLRLGALVRFLPYPVVAGFLAGSGWLLIEGAVVMLSGQHNLSDGIEVLISAHGVATVLPALLFAVAMLALLRRSSHPVLPAVLLALAAGLFYLGIHASGVDIDQARAWHWLPQDVPDGGGPSLASPWWVITSADWTRVATALPAMVSAALLNMVGVLLNTSGLELSSGREIDANAELRSTGGANLAVGVFGGASGYVGLGMTLLAGRMGVHGRGAGIATAAVLAGGFLFAPSLASYMPAFLAAGLMFFLGLELLLEWAWASRRQLPLGEWLVVVAILLAIMLTGFLVGLALGVAVSVVMFVYNYARLPVIRLSATGVEMRSSVDRSAAATHVLDTKGTLIHVLQMQGYLFFGTVEQVVGRVRDRLRSPGQPPLRFLILDFRGVSGMDSAAVSGFTAIRNMADLDGVRVVFSHLSVDVIAVLERAGLCGVGGQSVASDLDHALERCEEALLEDARGYGGDADIVGHLAGALGQHARLGDMVTAMDRLALEPGTELIRVGEAADDVFVLGHGRVKVQVTLPNGRTLRLRTLTAGAVVGEIALYLGGTRTADAVVETPCTVFRLRRDHLHRLEREDGELALLFHRLLAVTLAEKLVLANRLIALSQN